MLLRQGDDGMLLCCSSLCDIVAVANGGAREEFLAKDGGKDSMCHCVAEGRCVSEAERQRLSARRTMSKSQFCGRETNALSTEGDVLSLREGEEILPCARDTLRFR